MYKVAVDVNGVLFEQLAQVADHDDKSCVNFFRGGGPFLGLLDRSGIGDPCGTSAAVDVSALAQDAASRNAALLETLSEDPQSERLLVATREDAKLGRMTEPRPLGEASTSNLLLHPRFSVEKIKKDGEVDIRPIDHFSWAPRPKRGSLAKRRKQQKEASVNGHVMPQEVLKHDHSANRR